MRYFWGLVVVVLLGLGALGCEKSAKSASKKTSKAPKGSVEGYALNIVAPKTSAVGQQVSASIKLSPRAPYKINVEYPLKVSLKAPPTARMAKRDLGVDDAKRYEKDGVSVFVPYTLDRATEASFSGEVRFSICTETTCELKRAKVGWVSKGYD